MSIKLLASAWYKPDCASEGEEYEIRGLTGIEALPVVNFFRAVAATALREKKKIDGMELQLPADLIEPIALAGILGWRGVDDAEGAKLAFDKERIRELPWDRLDELVGEIMERSMLTGAQVKNLSSPSKSPKRRKNSTA